jgi:hypothetical protein
MTHHEHIIELCTLDLSSYFFPQGLKLELLY